VTEVETTLWVDRYRPQKFTDLLGNERVARDTMTWVKQWDYCVFGKKKGKQRQKEDDPHYNPDDEYRRPKEKVRTCVII
jgi:chromosome transmission fidelity protein 18